MGEEGEIDWEVVAAVGCVVVALDRGKCGAGVALLELALAGAAVMRIHIAIVTLLQINQHSIPANRNALAIAVEESVGVGETGVAEGCVGVRAHLAVAVLAGQVAVARVHLMVRRRAAQAPALGALLASLPNLPARLAGSANQEGQFAAGGAVGGRDSAS